MNGDPRVSTDTSRVGTGNGANLAHSIDVSIADCLRGPQLVIVAANIAMLTIIFRALYMTSNKLVDSFFRFSVGVGPSSLINYSS